MQSGLPCQKDPEAFDPGYEEAAPFEYRRSAFERRATAEVTAPGQRSTGRPSALATGPAPRTRVSTSAPSRDTGDDRNMVWSLLIVDDHPEFRRAARELLSSEDFVVVGVAGGAFEAVSMARALEPDLVLLDIKLPDGDGFAVAETLAGLNPSPAVVLTSSHEAAVFGARLASAAARGFLPKAELSVEALSRLVGAPR